VCHHSTSLRGVKSKAKDRGQDFQDWHDMEHTEIYEQQRERLPASTISQASTVLS